MLLTGQADPAVTMDGRHDVNRACRRSPYIYHGNHQGGKFTAQSIWSKI